MQPDLEAVRRVLPDYEVIREIGRGQFGVVWLGRHRQLHRDVAIKQLAIVDGGEYQARFRREARLLAQIDHPHVVRVFDYRESEGAQLLVMEFLSGGTLADRQRAGLTPATAVAATLAAASGLSYVHGQGVLHRDIKPENLMFDSLRTLKVTDFGVARGDLVDATVVNMTRAGEFFGTPAYAAPEQCAHALGNTDATIDAASDQYSLAAVLYEALSNRLTHDAAGGAVALCRRRVEQDAQPLDEAIVPGPIANVVMRALAREPAARFASLGDFGTALAAAATDAWGEGWLADADVQVRDTGPILRGASPPVAAAATARSRPGRRRLLVGAAIALVAVVVGLVVWTPHRDKGSAGLAAARSSAPQFVRRWSVATRGPVFSSPAVSQGLVVFGSDDGAVRAVDAITGASKWRYQTGAPVRSSPTFANGRVYTGSNDGNVYAFDLRGAIVWKKSLGFEIVSSPAVSGNTVVVGADKLVALDAATGATRWTFSPHDVIVSSPRVAGATVIVGSNDHNVYGVSLADGREQWHLRTAGPVQSSPVVDGGTAYVGGVDGFVYAINVASGANTWATNVGAPVKSSPTVADGHVIVGTDSGALIALNARTGANEWSYQSADRVDSSPAVLNDLTFVGSNDKKVYAVHTSTGVLVASFATGGPVLSSPVSNGDAIVVGSNDGSVYDLAVPPAH